MTALVFVLVVFFVFSRAVFACIALGAGVAIIGYVAEAGFGAEFIAGCGAGYGMYGFLGDNVVFAIDVLGGDLEGVEKEAGAARVELRGTEAVENLGEGDPNGAAIFEEGQLERFAGSGCGAGSEAVHAVVEVAKRLIFQGDGSALEPIGHDVAALHVHTGTPLPPYFWMEVACLLWFAEG